MAIRVACSKCGAAFRVPDDRGGQRGKCPRCGAVFLVPVETYAMAEDDGAGVPTGGGSTFVVTPADPEAFASTPRRKAPEPPRERRPLFEFDEENNPLTRFGRPLAIVSLIAALGFGLFGLLPGGAWIGALGMGAIGIIFFLVGFGVVAWIAWTEDSLYGFLYLVFPLYTAYYIVSRWSVTGLWFGCQIVGALLCTVALWLEGRAS